MTIAIARAVDLHDVLPIPVPDPLSATRERIRLGMPHLSLRGLSETWLLKELGHRHWQMLAHLAGRERSDFRDLDGEPVYAAFCAVTIRDAELAAVSEHDDLVIASEIARISRTQFASRHRLSLQGHAVGTIELSSVFVKRHQPGQNRSIARIALDGFPPPMPNSGLGDAARLAADMRAADWIEHFGFRKDESRPIGQLTITPGPAQDFNGAGFLYFAAFQGFVDRMEWELLTPDVALTTVARDLVYYGNIELGERIVVTLCGLRQSDAMLAHWCSITRERGGSKLADVFTVKRAGGPRPSGRGDAAHLG